MPFKNMSRRNESSSALQIINSNADHGSSVNASVLTDTKEVFLLSYIQKLCSGTMDHTGSHMAPYKRIIQPQKENFTSNVRATKHQATFITITTIVLHSLPQCNAKETLYLLCQTMILLLLNIMTIAKCIIPGTSQRVMNKQQQTHTRQ